MSSAPAQAAGRGPAWIPLSLLLFALLMAAVHLGRVAPRVQPHEGAREDHRARGRRYEEHVFQPGNLPRIVEAQRGTLRLHPVIVVAPATMPARYYAAPRGYDGSVMLDESPHAKAPSTWAAVGKGGTRVPDAIAYLGGGREVLYELKCPSPWLVFSSGNPWSAKMQAAFASQAFAFALWAAADPKREVQYGFCGLPPPWAMQIIEDVRQSTGVDIRVNEAYFIQGFQPAAAFVAQAQRELLAAAALGELEHLAVADLAGAAYDRLSD